MKNSQQEQNESTEGTVGACSRAMLKVTIVTAICLDYNIGLRSHSVFETTNLLIHTVLIKITRSYRLFYFDKMTF